MTVIAAIIVAVAAWWISTGLVIMIVRGLGGRAFALGVATLTAGAGLIAIWVTRDLFTLTGNNNEGFSTLSVNVGSTTTKR